MNKLIAFGLLTFALVSCGCDSHDQNQDDRQVQSKQEQLIPAQQINENLNNERETVNTENKKVKLQTSMGDIVIELNADKAPITVKNFLGYVESGFYNGTIFHRAIKGFMIQGGGLTADMNQKTAKAPIKNEFKISNTRGTVAMAKLGGNPDSATCQFFISVADNSANLDHQNGGFTVFGKVVEGMDVVDKIASVKTTVRRGMSDVPVEVVTINSASVISQ